MILTFSHLITCDEPKDQFRGFEVWEPHLMIELSLNPALYLMRKSLMAGGKTLWPSKGIDLVSGEVRGASGVKTIYQRKRVNLHPTRYRRPFSQEKGQFVSKTRIRGPLVSSAGTIGTTISTSRAFKSVHECASGCLRVCKCLRVTLRVHLECGQCAYYAKVRDLESGKENLRQFLSHLTTVSDISCSFWLCKLLS